ncbi:MAG: Asp-tRNA(Asn)/Glu-tRNA(Gln) amidotransferase subunit GatA [Spirochaetales bacterium]|nr:Asp-tRNA(Asn)/Glu-tRNA(Gln) amidotransferase subunit GatA [Spirochaetales bacterium]
MSEQLTYKKFLNQVKSGGLSLPEYYQELRKKIEAEDKEINSLLAVNNTLDERAAAAQVRYNDGTNRELEGIAVAVKDNIAVEGMPNTCASKILEHFIPPYQATVVQRLCDAGAIFVGKTNMDEFAMGSTTETSAFGATKNPVNKQYVPGGSSGGSAAAVAAGFVPAALGTDTGGSVRQPASFCGVVGYKPTYGLLSRWGVTAFGSSLDQVGTVTLNCEDAALLTSIMMGIDEKDSTSSSKVPENIKNFAAKDIKGKKIGIICETLENEHTDEAVRVVMQKKIEDLKAAGAVVEMTSIEEITYGVSIYYIIAPAEASSNLARYDGVRYGLQIPRNSDEDVKDLFTKTRSQGFGDEVKRRIILGNFVLSSGYYDAYYKKAQKARIVLADRFMREFDKYDYLITPTSPVLPFKLGENFDDPLKLYTADLCTIPVNLAGLPAVSIPIGTDAASGLPVGMQLIGKRFDDGLLLGTGEFILGGTK